MSKTIEVRGNEALAVREAGSAQSLVDLINGPDEWIENRAIVAALGLNDPKGNKSLTGHWFGSIAEYLGEDTKTVSPSGRSTQGRPMRVYSRRGVAIVALRGRTANAEAFRRWAASQLVARGPMETAEVRAARHARWVADSDVQSAIVRISTVVGVLRKLADGAFDTKMAFEGSELEAVLGLIENELDRAANLEEEKMGRRNRTVQ